MAQNNLYVVKKAYFPFNLILWIFFISRHKAAYHEVAMIDPFFLNIVTIGDNLIDEKMYKHEKCHIEQVKREGRLKFLFKYLYYNIRYGYERNPYELEANEQINRAADTN